VKKVLVVGSAVVDVIAKSTAFRVIKDERVRGGVALCEVYGGKMELENMFLAVGGAGTNVAVGLRRLGLLTASLVRIGNDLLGELIINQLKLEGVETVWIQKDKEGKTGTSIVLVAADGGRSIMTYRGVSKEVEGKEIDWDKLAGVDWIQISSLGGNLSLIEDLVSFAFLKKIQIGFNPGKLEMSNLERLKNLLKKVNLLIVNKTEAGIILRKNDLNRVRAAKDLLELGSSMVAVTEGKKGACLADGERVLDMASFRVKSIDDTGAGDGFCAGLVAGLIQGKALRIALKMGVANGASEVTKLGVKNGLLYDEEVSRWLTKKIKTVEEKC
jgi:sugar/nucleoside kinase (ribokinase family)